MYTVYRTKAADLDEQFLAGLKAAFQGKEIEIAVSEVDETEYLLRSPANRDRLLRAVEEIDSGQNLIVPDQAQFR